MATSRIRWAILALLFGSTVINYLDRQALSILATSVQADLDIDDLGYARIVQLFLIAYTLAYLVAGRITDWLGTKLSLALFVGWWSLANLLTGFVRSPVELPAMLVADLADDRSVQTAAAMLSERGVIIDIVVHAAGLCLPGGVLDTSTADFVRQYQVNTLGAVRLIQRFAPGMMDRGAGSFVMLSSINARYATPTLAAYAASKAALENLVKTAAVELAEHNVRINAIAPASVDTPMLRRSFDRTGDPDDARTRNIARHPLRRLGTPGDVAELAVFLASEDAGWVTGGVFPVDGGASVWRA